MHTTTEGGRVPVRAGTQETLPATHRTSLGWLLRRDDVTLAYDPQPESKSLSPYDVFQLKFTCGCHVTQQRDGEPIARHGCGLHGAAVLATKLRRPSL